MLREILGNQEAADSVAGKIGDALRKKGKFAKGRELVEQEKKGVGVVGDRLPVTEREGFGQPSAEKVE
jgi:hypothetical protein